MTTIIGLCGYGGVGKDEVGRLLVENHGFTRFAKGDLIKQAWWRLNPIVEVPVDWEIGKSGLTIRERVYERGQHLAERLGAPTETTEDMIAAVDKLKLAIPDVRLQLQTLADETIQVAGRDWWNDALYGAIEEHFQHARMLRWERPVVLTRLSLRLEADKLHAHGGRLVRVERPGFGPANSNQNEVDLDTYRPDYVLVNGGTIDELAVAVRVMAESLA